MATKQMITVPRSSYTISTRRPPLATSRPRCLPFWLWDFDKIQHEGGATIVRPETQLSWPRSVHYGIPWTSPPDAKVANMEDRVRDELKQAVS